MSGILQLIVAGSLALGLPAGFGQTASAERIDPNNPGPGPIRPGPAWVAPIRVCNTITLSDWDGTPIYIRECRFVCPPGSVPVLVIFGNAVPCRDH